MKECFVKTLITFSQDLNFVIKSREKVHPCPSTLSKDQVSFFNTIKPFIFGKKQASSSVNFQVNNIDFIYFHLWRMLKFQLKSITKLYICCLYYWKKSILRFSPSYTIESSIISINNSDWLKYCRFYKPDRFECDCHNYFLGRSSSWKVKWHWKVEPIIFYSYIKQSLIPSAL